MDNHRAGQRHRTLKEGKVILSDWTSIDCLVRDMSDVGARLQFGGPTEIPDHVRVLLMSSNRLYPAHVAWRRGQTAGIRFTGPGQDGPARKS